MFPLRAAAAAALILPAALGCSKPSAGGEAPPAAAAPVSVAIGSLDQFQATLAGLRGRAVLVNFWAMW